MAKMPDLSKQQLALLRDILGVNFDWIMKAPCAFTEGLVAQKIIKGADGLHRTPQGVIVRVIRRRAKYELL